jgi:hypothetical protein
VPLNNTLGLHGSNPRENIQDLLIALEDDLAVEVQFVHGENEGSRPLSELDNDTQYPLVRVRRRAVGSIRRAGVCSVSIGGEEAQRAGRRDYRSYGPEAKERLRQTCGAEAYGCLVRLPTPRWSWLRNARRAPLFSSCSFEWADAMARTSGRLDKWRMMDCDCGLGVRL